MDTAQNLRNTGCPQNNSDLLKKHPGQTMSLLNEDYIFVICSLKVSLKRVLTFLIYISDPISCWPIFYFFYDVVDSILTHSWLEFLCIVCSDLMLFGSLILFNINQLLLSLNNRIRHILTLEALGTRVGGRWIGWEGPIPCP